MVKGKYVDIDPAKIRILVEKGWTEKEIAAFFGCTGSLIRKKCPGMLKMGRPLKELTPEILRQVHTLSMLQCTEEEIQAVIGVGKSKFTDWKKIDEFSSALQKGREEGKVALRRKRFQIAMGDESLGIPPNVTMQIWLSKQMLGESDNVSQKTEISGHLGCIMTPFVESEQEWLEKAKKQGNKPVPAPSAVSEKKK